MINRPALFQRIRESGRTISGFSQEIHITRAALYQMHAPDHATICAIAKALSLRSGEIEEIFFPEFPY